MPASARPACTRGQICSGGGADVLEPECDLVRDPPEDDLVLRILEERGDASRELGRARAPGVAALDLDPALEAAAVEVRDETGERPQERRLPRARRAEQRDDLPGLDPQRDVRERRARRVRVREGEPFDGD